MYKDIAALIDDETDFENYEKLSNFLYRMSRFGDIVIFDKNFEIIHSTIPDFTGGAFMPLKEIFTLGKSKGRALFLFF
jgi:hypothetical protein